MLMINDNRQTNSPNNNHRKPKQRLERVSRIHYLKRCTQQISTLPSMIVDHQRRTRIVSITIVRLQTIICFYLYISGLVRWAHPSTAFRYNEQQRRLDGSTRIVITRNSQQNQEQPLSPSTNPYYSGCLYRLSQKTNTTLSSSYQPRVCNSNDPPNAAQNGWCRNPDFETYLEIRIVGGNWNSATMLGWLAQILLSEIVGIPTTIESGAYGASRDFYDYNSSIDWGEALASEALITAADLPDSDCTKVPKLEGDEYIPCAHFYPEFWGVEPLEAIKDMKVEPSQATGFLGYESWFVTIFTAREYPQLVSYHGLEHPRNRQLLAETFKRPTTWKQYCEEVSTNNCTIPDHVALRAPETPEEADKMFATSTDASMLTLSKTPIYTGHFRYTEKNNCTLFPLTCTGHIANYPCGWSSNMESQLYYQNIPLDANNGPIDANGTSGPMGYTESQLREMWHAANYTKSHLMMQWWTPEPLYQQYLGTDAEMQPVTRRPYSRECAYARNYTKEECAVDLKTRVGAPEEACGDSVEPIRKLINVGLKEALNSPDIPEEARSPAYDILRFFSITEIQLGELFDAWDTASSPREGVCEWAAANMDKHLYHMIPPSYPRVVQEESHSSLGLACMIVGSFATVVVLATACLVFKYRQKSSVRYAQIDFLAIILAGSFLVGVGSVLLGAPASSGTCISSIWFVNVGYTLELVPLILKVATINRLMAAAREMRRISVQREVLYNSVASISLIVVGYLAVWTVVSPPQAATEYTMTSSLTESGETVVGKHYFCDGGGTQTWQFVAVAWTSILLLSASVLAFQTRNVIQAFNESRTLGMLIYSHFIFVLARIGLILLGDKVDGSTVNYSLSLTYAIDQMTACSIYFFPKFLNLLEYSSSSVIVREARASSCRLSIVSLDQSKSLEAIGGQEQPPNNEHSPSDRLSLGLFGNQGGVNHHSLPEGTDREDG